MNTKQELLQNPLVKEIVQEYRKFVEPSVLIGENCYERIWDDFVKSNEPVREWEILKVKNPVGYLYALRENGQYSVDTPTGIYPLKGLLANATISIHQVRRNSDKEVFSIGDNISFSEITGKISAFEVQEEKLLIHVIRPCGGIVKNIYIAKAQKTKEPFLFVTKDGHFVFNGDEYWAIYSGGAIGRFTATKNDIDFQNKITSFSTEQAAKDFVLASKPCLSVSDVLSFTFSESVHVKRLQEQLLELAKGKQNKS